jgi:hypothetical protein
MAESRRPPEIRSDKKYLYHLIMFIASIIIVVAISPREGKFRYEYQKGKPWLGSSLIAPRDFPVLKPESEINRERDSILNSFSPYFRLDSQVEKDEITGFDLYLNDLLVKFESEVHLLDPLGFVSVKRELNSLLAEIYQRGVLESIESFFAERTPDEVTIVTGKLAEKRQYGSIFNQKSAYQYSEDKKS